MTAAADWVASRTGYRFKDESLLTQALTHRSAEQRQHYERLEFLGDALLNFIVAELVYHARLGDDEGDLSRLRSTLVRGGTLAEVAAELGLGSQLILGSGEQKTGGQRRRSILADALEALLAAIYLDGGLAPAAQVVERLFGDRLARLPQAHLLKDPKTRLQEWLQARALPLPVYTVLAIGGEEHAQQFTVCCRLEQPRLECIGEGAGRRLAEQRAADRALAQLQQAGDGR